jgi:TetR/AcrR family fatty acid metabolism transcriptional regulator
MTDFGHLVIVRRWNAARLEELLDEYVGDVESGEPKGRKRLQILEAATRLFIEQGYRKTSVDQVAREAGVAKGTVYLYFETKSDLLIAAIALEKKAFLGRIRPVIEEDLPPRERLKRYLVTVLVVANEMPLVSRLMSDAELVHLLRELPPELVASNQAMGIDFMSEMLEELVGARRWNRVELEDRARVLIGVVSFAGMLGKEEVRRGLSIRRFATILAEMIVDGLDRPAAADEEGT